LFALGGRIDPGIRDHQACVQRLGIDGQRRVASIGKGRPFGVTGKAPTSSD
jgi:hypothetical protein